jgi:hypothetical protein
MIVNKIENLFIIVKIYPRSFNRESQQRKEAEVIIDEQSGAGFGYCLLCGKEDHRFFT